MHTNDLIEKFFETDGRLDAGQSSARSTQVGGGISFICLPAAGRMKAFLDGLAA